jgi:hypothetical protein
MSQRNPVDPKYRSIAKNVVDEKMEMEKRKSFSPREVGITHPDNSSFIRLTDAGDIEIFSAPGVGIVISAATRTVSIFADNIRFHTKDDGLKWNSMDFNYSADSFVEPALIKSDTNMYNPAYVDIDMLVEGMQKIALEEEQEEPQKDVTINGNYLYSNSNLDITDDFGFDESTSSLSLFTEDQIKIMKNNWDNLKQAQKDYQSYVDYITNLMQSGYTFGQANEKAIRDYNV